MTESLGDPVRWVPLAYIEKHAYCPRQAVLADREPWTDNVHTASGLAVHARINSGVTDGRRGVTIHHNVPLRHDGLRIHGIADTVEESVDGTLTPVEVKVGSGRSRGRAAALQAVAQALCLQHMTGRPVPTAVVYHRSNNQRESFSAQALAEELATTIDCLRAALTAPGLPAWSSYPSRCTGCSLRPTCMPELTAAKRSR